MPVEISHTSPRITAFEPEANEEGMKLVLDLIDEVRDKTHAKIIEYQKRTSSCYNLGVKGQMFKEGDLVLRKVEPSRIGKKGKLSPNWEGPYRVNHLRGPRAYKLETLEGDEVPRTWHASNLKVYYISPREDIISIST